MRRLLKTVSITALVLTLMLSMTVSAFAADASVTYTGGGFEFGPGSEMSETQLFPEFENVMPGDVLTQKITVTNRSDNSDYIKIYLRAEAHDENTNPLETGVKDTETVASMTDFLKQLGMKVTNGSEVIFESSPDQTADLTENVLLGALRYGESLDLTVELTVPADLGNEYAERSGEVDWIFTAEELNDGASMNISLKETSKPENKNGYREGETIEYEISVINDGNVVLTNVVVTDPETGETWTIETLNPGETVSFKTGHVVTADDVKKGSFTNSASAEAEPDNPDLAKISAGPVKVVSGTYDPSEGPDTGDHSNMFLWAGVMAAAVTAMILLLNFRRKKYE